MSTTPTCRERWSAERIPAADQVEGVAAYSAILKQWSTLGEQVGAAPATVEFRARDC
jgi:hypothetical protein